MVKSEYVPLPTIIKAVDQLVDMCKPTFGPAGNKVIIVKDFNKEVIDDGVQIAKQFQVEDDLENAVVDVIKQVAIKTNDRVGDGTTGSLIMLQAIMKEIEKLGKIDTRKVSEELKQAVLEARDTLISQAKSITKLEDLEKVARISFDNPEMAKTIAEIIHTIGADGVVAVQESNTMEVESEIVEGFEFDKGYVSPYMVTNEERMEAELEKPVFLITDYSLTIQLDIVPILEKIVKAGYKNIVIMAEDFSGDALAIAIVNKSRFNTVAIRIPGYGDEKGQFIQDLATVTGATIISQNQGMKLEDFDLTHLGQAEKVISKQHQTVVIGGKGKKEDLKKECDYLKLQISESEGYKKELLERRLARLMGSVAIIKVGAATEHEMKALKYKVEDAVNAVKVAYKSGIVAGGGWSLARLNTSSDLLNKALKKPKEQLSENSGVDMVVTKDTNVLNLITGEEGDFLKVGVVDPVDVLIAQIESAVSIAQLLITTKGIIVHTKEVQHA